MYGIKKGIFHFSFRCFLGCVLLSSIASAALPIESDPIQLKQRPGFFRFSFDSIKMPNNIQDMGLLGVNYFTELNQYAYGGLSGYGSVTGSQGGLFVLGFAGGLHYSFYRNWFADAGLFVGGGGGRSSLVGGGLMVRPHVGLEYNFGIARLGVHYSYVNFPSGLIHSQQIGLDVDIPCDFYYLSTSDQTNSVINITQISLFKDEYLKPNRNDFALLLQAYRQKPGTQNVNGEIQDGTISLIGAELDHYLTDHLFGYLKAAGAYHGIPNGYMDILGGLGIHWEPSAYHFAIVPQLGVGAGGGGNVQTGGGVIIQPQLGLEIPLSSQFAARVSGGYLWAPKGNLKAATATAELIYHLNFMTLGSEPVISLPALLEVQNWRLELFNQTYIHPQRENSNITSNINLIAFQIDQFFTKHIFFSYQAASAYSGDHAGGYATGMIGPGVETNNFFNHLNLFGEVLVGAGGGGNLSVGGGAIVEPVIGAHVPLTKAIGLIASLSDIHSVQHKLNTPVVSLGLTVQFGMLDYS